MKRGGEAARRAEDSARAAEERATEAEEHARIAMEEVARLEKAVEIAKKVARSTHAR